MTSRGHNMRKPRYGEALVGRTLRGKWHLDELLGVGGTACVYAATHRNGLRAAVKRLHPEMAEREEVVARFLQEGRVANRVCHPGALSIYDDDRDEEGVTFLVMELLEGETVSSLAKKRPKRRLEVAEVLDIAEQALEVLVAAHGAGVLHRDIKPENLFVDRHGRIRLLDFGIAKAETAPCSQRSGEDWTKTGLVMGTPGFLAPEQAMGDWDAVDARADVWAMGATMFSMLTGRPVHVGDTVNQLLFASMTKSADGLADVLPHLEPEVVELVDRALAFKPEHRFPSARAMLLALREVRAALDEQQLSISVDDLDPPTGEESTLRWARGEKPIVLPELDEEFVEAPTEAALVIAPEPRRPSPRPTLVRRRRNSALLAAAVVVAVVGLFALLLSGTSLAAEADAASGPRLAARLAASATRVSSPVVASSAVARAKADVPPRATTSVEVAPAPPAPPVKASSALDSYVPTLPSSLSIR